MGSNTVNFPLIEGTVVIDWNDVNLRLGYVTWVINSAATVRVRIWRINISPDPIVDQTIISPASDNEPVPGNLRMEWREDPEYPEEPPYLCYPDGLVFNMDVVE